MENDKRLAVIMDELLINFAAHTRAIMNRPPQRIPLREFETRLRTLEGIVLK